MKTSVSTPENQLEPEAAVSSMSTSSNEQAQLLDHPLSAQALLTAESKGRNRASAVVLGIALSVGTSSMLLPMQTRKAAALSSFPAAETLDVTATALASPIATPSPLASPIPSALQLALSTATPANPVAPSTGYNSVVQGGEELLSLSKQSLATASPIAVVPEPASSPTPTVEIAATLTPEASPTLNELANIDGSVPGVPTPIATENAVAITATPALPAPVEQQVEVASPQLGNTELSPIQTLSLLSPSPVTTPSVVVTPGATVAPQYTPPKSSGTSAKTTAGVSPKPVETPAVTATVDAPQDNTLAANTESLSGSSLDLSKVPVLPELNAAEVSALPSASEVKTTEVASIAQPAETTDESPIQRLERSQGSKAEKSESTAPQSIAILVAPQTGRTTVASPMVPDASVGAPHRVSRGETLSAIARRYGVPVSELISANKISNPNQILVDQELTIPQRNADTTIAQGAPLVLPGSAQVEGVAVAMQPTAMTEDSTPLNAIAPNPYLQNLKAEIEALQQKYQQGGSPIVATLPVQAPTPVPAAKLAAEPINPEFVRERTNTAQPLPATGMGGEIQRVAVRPVLEPPAASYNVAVAPLAPSSYVPTLESTPGVIADLPRLAAANTYLPNEAGEFKGYIWPTKGVLTSGYGWRWGRMHRGIDVAGPTGTPIVAAATGVVEYAQWNSGGYGYLVDIRHPDGSLTRYGHNSRILVREGQRVQQGQLISEMGSTGFSTGPHLHFEIHPAGQGAVNPMAFMPSNAPS